MPGKRKQYSESFWAQVMRPIGCKGGSGIAQHGRSVILMIALLIFCYFFTFIRRDFDAELCFVVFIC